MKKTWPASRGPFCSVCGCWGTRDEEGSCCTADGCSGRFRLLSFDEANERAEKLGAKKRLQKQEQAREGINDLIRRLCLAFHLATENDVGLELSNADHDVWDAALQHPFIQDLFGSTS
jgi:hypothetical protein